jgi:hypothetical protein
MAALLLLALLAGPEDAPKPGEFPAEGSGREISGELIALDHVLRTGQLRPDRNDSQRTDDYDIAFPFALLPYAKVLRHGAYADLRDVPIGTHLHGVFFLKEGLQKNPKPVYEKVLRLEDDFSRMSRLGRAWRVDSVDAPKGKLTVTGLAADGAADAKPTVFQVGPATRIWKGRAIGTLGDLAAGQKVLANLTACTLKGPGRCTDVWIDEESRALARDRQVELHKLLIRERGLGCWIDAVDNASGVVTATLFDAADPSLLKELRVKEHVAASVAEDSLRTYDQTNDTRRGPVLELKAAAAAPGSSGIQVLFKPDRLLEGYRPKRYLRLFAGGWRVDDLPREERLYR